MTLEVGGATETVNVTAEAALVQSQSGERSFAVTPSRWRTCRSTAATSPASIALCPASASGGASAGGTRLGGVSQNNIMMDGISAMDTGNNGQMLNMNIESIGEVKILTQGYQAEYGRSSGLQITAVTKSGTNQFRGSATTSRPTPTGTRTSWVDEQNGDPKPKTEQKTYGYTIGGPVGKPGGTNKLFFFYAHEYRPTTTAINSGNAIRLRVPTALERAGRLLADASTTTARSDSRPTARLPRARGAAPFPRRPARSRPTGCIESGMTILNRYPLPNVTQAAGTNYNYEIPAARSRPTENLIAAAGDPARLPVDRRSCALTGKYSGERRAQARSTPGTDSGIHRRPERRIPYITNYARRR